VDENGWRLEGEQGFLPVEIGDLAFWSQRLLMTQNGEVWIDVSGGDNWVNMGLPDTAIGTKGRSVGQVKALFDR